MNPSRKACARVKDPMPAPTDCPYCEHHVSIRHHVEVYNGRSFSEWPWMYVCDMCGARVGMHPFTNIPLGTLADEETREARKRCKPAFERLWQELGWQRDIAYAWLAKQLGIQPAQCHWGLFYPETCERARQLCVAKARELRA
jgi:hypothetical protein